MESFVKGFLICGGLIMAIGAQNAFVLKQGLLKRNIFAVALTCFLCDFVLISMGVLGFGKMISQSHSATQILALAGAVFLAVYGAKSLYSAYKGNAILVLDDASQVQSGRLKAITATLAITLLNPHVYLDCFALIGSIAGTLNDDQKMAFLMGALTTSALWFFGLGYGARLLIPFFKRPITWRILDGGTGIIMWVIAVSLLQYTFNG